MSLHSNSQPQADIRAFAAAQRLRFEVAGALTDRIGAPSIIEMMVDRLSPAVIQGYSFEVGDRLLGYMRERLGSTDTHQAAFSADAFIDYLSILASTRDIELRIEARRVLDDRLLTIANPLSLAS